MHEAMSPGKDDIYVEIMKILDTLLVISFGLCFINVHLSKAEISEKHVKNLIFFYMLEYRYTL